MRQQIHSLISTVQAGCSCFTTWLPTHLKTFRWERWELFSVSTWVSEELVELMTQLEFSKSCPSSLQCRVGWGYPPGQLQNSCNICPDEVSAQHFGVACGGSISKDSSGQKHLQGWNSFVIILLEKIFPVSLQVLLPDLHPTAPGVHSCDSQQGPRGAVRVPTAKP